MADWAGLGTGKNAERENIYKSRGPVGSKRAGGPRNGNDSLQGSLSLSLLFSSFILLLLSFFSQKQLEAVKGEKAVKTPSSSLFPSSSSSSFLLFHSLSTRILTIHVKAVSYIIAL